jgi:N-acetylmuramoyl-L-alanine amidase
VRFGVTIRGVGVLALVGLGGVAQAAEVRAVRVHSGPESTRVVIDLSGPAEHRLFMLSDPQRLVIDLPRTAIAAQAPTGNAKGVVARVRTGPQPNGSLRVVLDLNQSVKPKSFLLAPSEQFGHRLVVDLLPASATEAQRSTEVASTRAERELVVVIDAGHGGKDPGASGPRGAREKDVVLAIARQLSAELNRQPGIRTVMTRGDDRYVSFGERMSVARRAEADLFISIHADAYEDSSARGATVYGLSVGRASDEVTRRLAERENAADLIGGVSIADKDDMLARVLLDLSQNAAISASMLAGQEVIDALGSVTRMRKTRVQQGSFLVLTSPDIPSILIETAYISNPREESALRDPNYQNDLARAVSAGVIRYFRSNAPPESLFARSPSPQPRTSVRHVISRGETLSGIAAQYRVSLTSLRQSNSIRGDSIRVGQVITIPTTRQL